MPHLATNYQRPMRLSRLLWAEARGHDRKGTMLANSLGIGNLLVEPFRLGAHRGSDEVSTGQIFTNRAGFIDLGHLRNYADHVRTVFDQLAACGGKKGSVIKTGHGETTLTQDVSLNRKTLANLALSIVWEDSVCYEEFSYGVRVLGKPIGFGFHSSAFSPEDLPSNYIGMRLARDAIVNGRDFNAEMTTRLTATLRELEAQGPKVAQAALERAVEKGWLSSTGGIAASVSAGYVRKRNFGRTPFRLGLPHERPAPAWLTAPLPNAEHLHQYVQTLGIRITRADRPSMQTQMHADARERYGSGYDEA